MAVRRRLPLVTEQSLAALRRTRAQLSSDFDRELFGTLGVSNLAVSCRVGCSNCCYHPVLITAMEGALLYQWLAERGRWTPSLQAKIKEHADRTRDLSYEVWFLSMVPCPMLDETTRKCTVYEGRPYACRVTYSLGDPDKCHPHRIGESGIVNKQEVMLTYHREQSKVARKHGLQMVLMPISLALRIGERIVNGKLDLESADLAILEEVGSSS